VIIVEWSSNLKFHSYRKNSFAKHKITISALLTLGIIGLLIFSGPVNAIVVTITQDKSTYSDSDESVVFTVDVDIEVNERVPVKNLTLSVTGSSSKSCSFYTGGAAISGCGNMTITAINVIGDGVGTLFGYGYGYDTSLLYNTSNQSFGSDDIGTGYGYTTSYDTADLGGELKYNVSWNITAESPGDGSYTAQLEAFAQNSTSSNYRIYMDISPTTFTVDRTNPGIYSYNVTNTTVKKAADNVIINANISDAIGYGTNNCSVKIANSSTSNTITASGGWCNGTITVPTDIGADGYKVINVSFSDSAGNTQYNTSYVINLDNSAPTISITSVGGDSVSTYATTDSTPDIVVSTSESALCKYAATNIAFASMTSFSSSGGSAHSTTLSALNDNSYTYYIRCRDNAGNIGLASVAFSVEATSGTTGTSGSSGSSSSTAVEPKYQTTFSSISAGETATVEITKSESIGVAKVTMTVVNNAYNVKVTVQKLASKPSGTSNVTNTVYKYLKLEATNLDDSNVQSAKIKFLVEKSWLTENNFDKNTVLLSRYVDNEWVSLETELVEEDSTYYYYEAITSGFSYFAVTAEEETSVTTTTLPSGAVCGNGECETGENCGTCLEDCSCASGYECINNACTKVSPVVEKAKSRWYLFVILLFAVAAVLFWLKQPKKGKPGKKFRVNRQYSFARKYSF